VAELEPNIVGHVTSIANTKCSDHHTVGFIAHSERIGGLIMGKGSKRKIEDAIGEDKI
jgi:hypothetical protein